jgi:serine/threonine-protein kinase
MATVHFGRLVGPAGFSRAVAIKRLHPQFARDPEFVAMFIDEARLAARISHPNVVPTLDVVAIDAELFLVMEYVRGASLSHLIRAARARGALIPPRIAAGIACGILQGLHAAHEARDEMGEGLEIVHRDVSPQNVMVDVDGVARVLDFGVAKAAGRAQTTRSGQLKGKLAYMAPEQLRGAGATRQSDVYGAAVVLWETFTATRLFKSDTDAAVYAKVLAGNVPPPSALAPDVPAAVDAVVLRGTAADPAGRYPSAREMACELEAAIACAPPREVGEWVTAHAAEELNERAARIAEIERSSDSLLTVDSLTNLRLEPATNAATPRAHAQARAQEGAAVQLGPQTGASVDRDPAATAQAGNRRRRGVVVAAAVGLLLGAILGAKAMSRSPASVETIRAFESAAAPTLTTFAAPLAPIPTPAIASAPPPTGDATVGVDPRAGRPTEPPVARPRSAPRKALNCDPPSTTDDRGHVHFKPECF